MYLSHIHLHLGGDTNASVKTVLTPKAPDSLFVPPISFQVLEAPMLDQDSAVTIRGRKIHTRRELLGVSSKCRDAGICMHGNVEHPSKDKVNAGIF